MPLCVLFVKCMLMVKLVLSLQMHLNQRKVGSNLADRSGPNRSRRNLSLIFSRKLHEFQRMTLSFIITICNMLLQLFSRSYCQRLIISSPLWHTPAHLVDHGNSTFYRIRAQ
ncbi:hypothetical protein FRC16_007437 [Serendipita sp. 398]|nr:hypothetical protein FRC16_007437 [Serendipita sp. 398]